MKKILVVDDEKSICFSLERRLTNAGYEVLNAGCLSDARALLSCHDFDVAVVDRLLGSENGLNLVADINSTQSFCSVILICSYPTFESASEGFKHGIFDYLRKPLKKYTLLKSVDAAFRRSEEKQNIYNELKLIDHLF